MKKYRSKFKEDSTWLPGIFSDIDPEGSKKINKLYPKISQELDWSLLDAYIFCVELLQDVNAHKEAKAVNDILYKVAKKDKFF